jgi:hypothetical protein
VLHFFTEGSVPGKHAFLWLSTLGQAKVLARLIHAETIHARDAYVPGADTADGVRLRERNETVHRLSGLLTAVLGERMSLDHRDHVARMIDLTAASSPAGREELMRWIADAERD